MRISDWSSDVCSSDLHRAGDIAPFLKPAAALASPRGWMIVRGYCVADEAIRDGERHRRWVAMEPARPRVPTQAELLRQVERIGFEIIDEADTADQQRARKSGGLGQGGAGRVDRGGGG